MKRNRRTRTLFAVLTVCFLVWIYHNSMFPINQSDQQSGFVQNLLNRLFQSMNLNITLSQYCVRKLAHFSEYFVFGMLLTITLKMYSGRNKNLYFELFLFIAIPVVDESIQMFYSGRNSSMIDVMIDFIGSFAGMELCHLLSDHPDPDRSDDNNIKK